MRRTVLAGVALAAVLIAACGEAAEPRPNDSPAAAPAAVKLRLTVRDAPDRDPRRATLACTGGRARATGYLAGRPAPACRAARRLAGLLAADAERHRMCTQIYGGPQRARVRGEVGRRAVDRRFSRTDGCQIDDWDRAAPLLRRTP
jgi:hypothetical protein